MRSDPPHAGRIKVNSLILDAFPWTGTYFQGAPVGIDVLPAPGFRFADWEGLPDSGSSHEPRLSLDLDRNLAMVARSNGER